MDGTDGLVRGQQVTDTGSQIRVPVGPETLGRIMNVIGEPIDERGTINAKASAPIHAEAPLFVDQSTESAVLVTGIKVIDLRSEAQTPDLQSIMRNPYAVFRLKNKTHQQP